MRNCDQLGICQNRQSPCAGCRPFAPGVIVGGAQLPRRSYGRTVLLWAWRVVSVLCVLIVLLGVVGLVRQESRPAASGIAVTPKVCGRGLM